MPGRFLEVNEIASERLGYTKEELLTMGPLDLDAPESLDNVPVVMERLRRDRHIVWEGIHMTKAGVKIPVEISNHLFSLEGKSVILSTVRDITYRKETEDLLKKSEREIQKDI
ncbi:MAG: PAS domain S-box protein [Bacteroidales bacterium]|nr:PAS domain S-box protein [Bacteroidales bacterium]